MLYAPEGIQYGVQNPALSGFSSPEANSEYGTRNLNVLTSMYEESVLYCNFSDLLEEAESQWPAGRTTALV